MKSQPVKLRSADGKIEEDVVSSRRDPDLLKK